MLTRRVSVSVVVSLVAGSLLLLVPLPSQGESDRIAGIRRQVQGQDYEGALSTLGKLRSESGSTADYYILRAEAKLGRALAADTASEEPLMQTRLTAMLVKGLASMRQKAEETMRPEAATVRQWDEAARAYVPTVTSQPKRYAELALRALEESDAACLSAQCALQMTIGSDTAHDQAATASAWCELGRYLILAEPASLLSAHGVRSVFTEDQLADAADVERKTRGEGSQKRLEEHLIALIREASERRSAQVALAVADCTVFYAARTGRLKVGPLFRVRHNLTHVSPIPAPAREQQAKPQDNATAAGQPIEVGRAAELLRTSPEALLAPFYAFADGDIQAPRSVGAHYGLLCASMLEEDKSVSSLVETWLKQHPRDTTFLLERARLSLAGAKDPAAVLTDIVRGLRGRGIDRPVFPSLPTELRPALLGSRHLRQLAPDFVMAYDPLFRMIDLDAGELRRAGKSNLPLLGVRLRLADALLQSSYLPDVFTGLKEANTTLAILKSKDVPEEQRAQAELYERDLAERSRRIPGPTSQLVVTKDGVRAYRYPQDLFVSPQRGTRVSAFLTGVSYVVTE